MENSEKKVGVVCRNIQNKDLYLYISDDRWRNLRTNAEGNVPPETAQKILLLNVEATYFYNENNLFAELINKLNLKIDKT
jgi:hypothetical protein